MSSSSSPKLLRNPYFRSRKLNLKSFPFPLSQLYLGFVLLNSVSGSSVFDGWFLTCKDPLKCESVPRKEFPLWRDNDTETCGGYPGSMNLNCFGARASMAIEGVNYELLGLGLSDQIVIIAEQGFSGRFCSPEKNISSSVIYAIIPVSYYCGHPKIGKPSCSVTEFGYMPFVNNTGQSYTDEYCWISAVVPISEGLLKQVGDDWRNVSQHIIAEFKSGRKVDGQVCRNCSILGGFYVYDLQTNQTTCCCKPYESMWVEICSSFQGSDILDPSPSEKSNTSKRTILIASSVPGSIILIIFIIIPIIYHTRKMTITTSNKQDTIEETMRRYSTQMPNRYTYSTLNKITDSFKNKLGQGGFSTVYKGNLPDGRDVAVKLLNESKQHYCQDFINEVISITTTSHVNIVTFLGFCCERNKRALIYEYMPNGSLDKYMFRKGPQKNKVELDWKTMYGIIIGVARGLDYLHRGCNTRILHFDIKPHNILLDDEFCPKISDFGLAKQCRGKQSHVSMTGAKGTIGFMAPEVVIRSFGKVSHKSDVYSYGMLVLEMVGERKSPNNEMGDNSEEYFPDWIYKNLEECEIGRNCKQWGETEEEEEIARKMVVVGLNCIQTLPENRPSMTEVVAMLEGSVDGLQIPPKPTLFGHPQAVSSSTSSYLDLPVDNNAECGSARIEVCEQSDHDTRQSLRP